MGRDRGPRRIQRSSGFAVAYVADGEVRQLAVVNGAIPVEEARAFVERHPSAAELRELDELRVPAAG